MPKLTIDGIEIEVEAGTSIIQAADQLGIEIPRFCYHDKLSVPANCRMCLVEVSPGPPKPQASCALACQDGMEVKTDSEMVHKARKGVMEMLLINHPLDCPICDQGGECDLQDQAVGYGFDRSRYAENKRAVKNKEIGPLIKTIMTRCIHCTRCVRFGEDIAGIAELGLLNRGEDVEIGTFVEQAVTTELSGNMIDVCPVGALTSKPYAFQARPWELRKTETIDIMDAVGSNIRVDTRGNEVLRVLPRQNDDVNEEWISDKTRFSYDGLKYQRLDKPYIRKNGQLVAVSWEEVFDHLADHFESMKGENFASLVGDQADLESITALKDFTTALGSPHMDCRTSGSRYSAKVRAGYTCNTTLSGLEEADAILLVGTNPRWEAAMLNARIRKAFVNSNAKIGVIGEATDLNYEYEHLGTSPKDLEGLMSARGGFASILRKAKKPVLILGEGALQRKDGMAVHNLAYQVAEKFKMVKKGWNGFNLLPSSAAKVGALDIGFIPQKGGADIFEMIAKAQAGEINTVYLLGVDNLDVRAAFGNKAFIIYQGHHGDNGAKHADVILPGAAYVEKPGIYINLEGRAQVAKPAALPLGEAKEDWKIIRALSEIIDKTLPYNTIFELRERIAKDVKAVASPNTVIENEWKSFGKKGKVTSDPFVNPISNFYHTCPISRASVTMAKCTESFIEPKMAQAAE